MNRARAICRLPVVLTLALFVSWLGAGVAHQHADNPSCQLCKLLHSGAVDSGRPSAAPAPALTRQEVTLPAAGAPAPSFIALPWGRAPPLA